MEPEQYIAMASVVFGSGGAAWAGTKAVLNGTRDRVQAMDHKLDKLLDESALKRERLARIEQRVEALERK